jgi:hypothetical protein
VNDVSAAAFFRLSRCYFGTSRLALRAKLARKILPVPEALVFEADEYLFTMAAVLARLALLPEALTHYRVHAGNLYLQAGASQAGERRKARVIAELAGALRLSLPRTGAPQAAVDALLEIVDAEAAQLRLKLDGGWPWETFQNRADDLSSATLGCSGKKQGAANAVHGAGAGTASTLVLWRPAMAGNTELVQARQGYDGSSAGVCEGGSSCRGEIPIERVTAIFPDAR